LPVTPEIEETAEVFAPQLPEVWAVVMTCKVRNVMACWA